MRAVAGWNSYCSSTAQEGGKAFSSRGMKEKKKSESYQGLRAVARRNVAHRQPSRTCSPVGGSKEAAMRICKKHHQPPSGPVRSRPHDRSWRRTGMAARCNAVSLGCADNLVGGQILVAAGCLPEHLRTRGMEGLVRHVHVERRSVHIHGQA